MGRATKLDRYCNPTTPAELVRSVGLISIFACAVTASAIVVGVSIANANSKSDKKVELGDARSIERIEIVEGLGAEPMECLVDRVGAKVIFTCGGER
jgi:hypothetical protein